jgi:hypothetical protein
MPLPGSSLMIAGACDCGFSDGFDMAQVDVTGNVALLP